jgi:hypothetical protein
MLGDPNKSTSYKILEALKGITHSQLYFPR